MLGSVLQLSTKRQLHKLGKHVAKVFSTQSQSLHTKQSYLFKPLNRSKQPAHSIFRRFMQQSQSNVNPDPSASERRERGEHRSKYFKWLKFFNPTTLVGTIVTFALISLAFQIYFDPNVRRPLKFWYMVMPIYLNYRIVQMVFNLREKATDTARESGDQIKFLLSPFTISGDVDYERVQAYDQLNEAYAPRVVDILVELGGFFVKLGQVGAMRGDFLPASWVKELEIQHSNAPYADLATVLVLLTEYMGRDPREVFSDIEEKPLGAASIAQVHKATLHDGRTVAVKVQFPDVQDSFATDMRTARAFCELVQPEQVPFIREIERQFMTEFDFEREADHLERIHSNMLNSPFKHQVRVPLPVREFCSESVLVMDYLNGPKLVDAQKNIYQRLAADQNLTQDDFLRLYGAQAPPSSARVRLYSTVFAMRDMLSNACRFAYNWTAGWVLFPMKYIKTQKPLDIAHLLDTLVSVHGHQVIVNGYFNGDPHPGNILLLQDGTIGLIDFGQVKSFNKLQRALYAHLMIALESGKEGEIANIHRALGHRSLKNLDSSLADYCRLGFDYDDENTRQGMHIQQYFEYLHQIDPLIQSGDEYVMAARMSILLRGFCQHMHYPVHMHTYFAPIGKKWLQENPEFDQWAKEYLNCMYMINKEKALGTSAEIKALEEFAIKGNILLKKDASK